MAGAPSIFQPRGLGSSGLRLSFVDDLVILHDGVASRDGVVDVRGAALVSTTTINTSFGAVDWTMFCLGGSLRVLSQVGA